MDSSPQGIVLLINAYIIGSKAIIFDADIGNKLFKLFYGKPFAEEKPKPEEHYSKPFVLSLYEALYLCKRGVVKPIIDGREATCSELEEYACKRIPGFLERYIVYEDLRNRGYIVRSGLKFGADFTVYEIGPGYEHAPYVVLVIRKSSYLDPISIVRIGRVSHSVRKKLVLAVVDPEERRINYLSFKWVKI